MTQKRLSENRHVLWLVGIGTALSLPGDNTLYIALPTHTAEAGITLASLGLMLSANRWIRVLLNTPYGYFLNKMPRRPILVGSLFLGAFSTVMYTVPGFWVLLTARVLWGLSWIGIWVGGNTVVMDISTDANRGRYTGQYQMWFFIGAGGSALLGGVLTDALGYRLGLLCSAGVTATGAVLWLLLLPETFGWRHGSQAATEQHHQHNPHSDSAKHKQKLAILTAGLIFAVNRLVYAGILAAVFALLLEARVGEVSVGGAIIPLTTLTGILTSTRLTISTASSPMVGWLSDLWRERWRLVIAALMIGAVSMAWIGTGKNAGLVAAICISAVVTGALQTLSNALVGDYTRVGQRSGALGLLNTLGDLGSALGPPIVYTLLPALGLEGVFSLAGACMALTTVWVGFASLSLKRSDQMAGGKGQ
jgi:MFS family permease